MNETKRHYESLYIVGASTTDEQLEPIISKYSQVVADQGGDVIAAGKWDRRRLAYEIKGQREGIYLLMYFQAEPSASKELDRVMRISDEVIRHMIVTVEPQNIDASRIKAPVAEEAPAEAPAEEVAETPEAEAPAEAPTEAPAQEPESEPEAQAEEAGQEEQAE